jgi:hypothetical protein
MSDLRAAVAAGVFGTDEAFRALLQATVETARGIFHAKASSVFLLDEETDELVFEAVAGEGSDTLVGSASPRAPAWRLGARDASAARRRRPDQGHALRTRCRESTGYVPRG